MAINICGFLKFFFWIKLMPVRRSKHSVDPDNKLRSEEELHRQENKGWELDYCSIRFLLLIFVMLGADTVYILFTISCVGSEINLFNSCILIFKLLNMTTAVLIPWQLGPAVCQMGARALPTKLTIAKNDLFAATMPIILFELGLICIHVHELAKNPYGLIPVVVSCFITGLSFMGMLFLLYAWMYDFRLRVKLAASQPTISVAKADEFLMQFDQLKNAVGTILFVMLGICQITQIFSVYNIFSGSNPMSCI
jgi:hypothetical protein